MGTKEEEEEKMMMMMRGGEGKEKLIRIKKREKRALPVMVRKRRSEWRLP